MSPLGAAELRHGLPVFPHLALELHVAVQLAGKAAAGQEIAGRRAAGRRIIGAVTGPEGADAPGQEGVVELQADVARQHAGSADQSELPRGNGMTPRNAGRCWLC